MNYFALSLSVILFYWPVALKAQGVEALDTAINTPGNEMNPILHPDGKTLYFTRANHPQNIGGKRDKGDIWYSRLGENGWETAKNLGSPINNADFNAIIGFSDDGQKMYLHNLYAKGTARQGISVSVCQGESWSFPEPVPVRHFYNKSDHQSISISRDDRIMLLAIDSYASYGAEDIYVSFWRSNGEWTDPLNLGPDINTPYQETTATLLKDNKTIIFSSNGHVGLGSMDLYYSQRLDDTWMKWSKPQNLGSEINTKGREMYYVLDPEEEYVYFISTQNSEGYGDVKRMKLKQDDLARQTQAPAEKIIPDEILPEKKEEAIETPITRIAIEGRIVNIKNQEPVNARITFIPGGGADQDALDYEALNGQYRVMLMPGEYNVKAAAKGFMTIEDSIKILAGASVIAQNFELSPLDVGTTFRLDNVLFIRGTTELLESSYAQLDQVVEIMKDNPRIKIELSGHTDNQGLARLNLKLSQERVEKVKEYLVQKSIDPSRVTGRGYGSSRPIASNNSEETRKLNRRVEFTILQN